MLYSQRCHIPSTSIEHGVYYQIFIIVIIVGHVCCVLGRVTSLPLLSTSRFSCRRNHKPSAIVLEFFSHICHVNNWLIIVHGPPLYKRIVMIILAFFTTSMLPYCLNTWTMDYCHIYMPLYHQHRP